jgi:hypothetical protein
VQYQAQQQALNIASASNAGQSVGPSLPSHSGASVAGVGG